ncbi:MAG: alpha/beta fold hydrolase [Polyangiaceae bacterium]|nr:alpha/beta fold hydrolase [Polyangiaceae bacterium]
MTVVNEKPIQFGQNRGLVGIVTVPTTLDVDRPAVIILNAGLIHRVGPFRLNVDLARRLVERDWLVFRIDQSGLGDSAARPGTLHYEERAVLDAQDAMDALSARLGVKRFIVVGLCAGGLSTHRAALEDERIVGGVLLDAYAYATPTHALYAAMNKAASPAFWQRAGQRALTLLRGARGGDPTTTRVADVQPPRSPESPMDGEQPGQDAAAVFAEDWPARDVIEAELNGILSRGTQLLFVYTGGWSDYVHRDQFFEMFPHLTYPERVQVEFYADADHTYAVASHRARMMSRVENFLDGFARARAARVA